MSNLECKFNETDVDILINYKPTVYQIFDAKDAYVYIGSTDVNRVIARLKEHLRDLESGTKGGVKVKIEPRVSYDEAKALEKRLIKKHQPPGNKLGK